MNATPLLKDLYLHVTKYYATDWKVIGTLLDIPLASLNIIEYDNAHKAVHCCNAMLEKWLKIDSTATWKKLLTAIDFVSTFSAPENGMSSNLCTFIHCVCIVAS